MATNRKEKRHDEGDETKISGSSSGTAAGSNTLPDKETNILPFLRQPEDEEAQNYYRGLPSCPRLVGRTSSGVLRWTMPIYNDEDTIDTGFPERLALRQATPIGSGHIALRTIESILPQIKEAIAALPWTCIDLLRIGLDTIPMKERPVVLWIGLQPKPHAWEDIARALRAVWCVLDGAGLDIECEFREAEVVLF